MHYYSCVVVLKEMIEGCKLHPFFFLSPSHIFKSTVLIKKILWGILLFLCVSFLYRKKNKAEKKLTRKKQIIDQFCELLYLVRLTIDLKKTKYLCLSSPSDEKRQNSTYS